LYRTIFSAIKAVFTQSLTGVVNQRCLQEKEGALLLTLCNQPGLIQIQKLLKNGFLNQKILF